MCPPQFVVDKHHINYSILTISDNVRMDLPRICYFNALTLVCADRTIALDSHSI